MKKNICFVLIFVANILFVCGQTAQYPFQNPKLPLEQRVSDLVSRLTLEEKVSQMMYTSVGIPRLGIPPYNWWNEALHGVARTGEKVTVFPQAIAVAATFNPIIARLMGQVASTEGRAIFNRDKSQHKETLIYHGLTYWTPNINIFRDPRWGRGQETYGEDPYLTEMFGLNMVEGLQGDDPHYMRAAACAKHFAVHSGPEFGRFSFNSKASLYDIFDTYLPSFRKLVMDGHVAGVMCAYNSLNGEPCCGNNQLMMETLRLNWGFKGYVTSDCGAIDIFVTGHKTHPTEESAAVAAVLNNTDLECGGSYGSSAADYKQGIYRHLVDAVHEGKVSEQRINESVERLYSVRFKLGLFDDDSLVPYANIPYSLVQCKEHHAMSLRAAHESIVLLKNDKNLLPLNTKKIKSILVVGPNADNERVLWSSYNGEPSHTVTPLEGIRNKFTSCKVDYEKGCNYFVADDKACSLDELSKKASKYDLIVFVGGINSDMEGENGDDKSVKGGESFFKGGDKTTLEFSPIQNEVFSKLKKSGRPLVFVNISGSALAFRSIATQANAVIQAFYGGQDAGTALADVLSGDYNPAGRLPLTFYAHDSDIPAFDNYSMENRTYRYFNGTPLFPFGYGLSFSSFKYGNLQVPDSISTHHEVAVSVSVTNTSKRDGDEVAQVYLKHTTAKLKPNLALKGFERVFLKAGETKILNFILTPEDLALVDDCGTLIENPDDIMIYVGGGQPQFPTTCSGQSISHKLAVKGDPYYLY
jgi:beta-glucosidase